jgi:transcriptional regulator with GAF, ATPase, and Fis domain
VVHLHPQDGRLRLQDQRSTNGTFLNGQQITEAPLAPGDLIRVGDSFLFLTLLDGDQRDADVPGLLGTCSATRGLRASIAQVATTNATVLLLGETGTGKEVAAHAIHQLSPRRSQPMQIFDCGAISQGLIESELFGHEKGAFTGATQSRKGLFEAAAGGTLFIDELGELPLDLQPKLLRALEQREIRRVGANRPLSVDVRIVAATNRDLAEEVRAGRFRADLHARLAEVVLTIPPLRERREDVLQILLHALGDEPLSLTPALVEALLLHSWPYNVREVYKLAVQLRTFPTTQDQDKLAAQLQRQVGPSPRSEAPPPATTTTPPPVAAPPSRKPPAPPSPTELASELGRHHGNVSAVAQALGVSRRQLHRWLKQHGLSGASYRRKAPR